jgi:hypothetical protein
MLQGYSKTQFYKSFLNRKLQIFQDIRINGQLRKCLFDFMSCGQYYKCFTIIIYDRNDSGQHYKTVIVVKASLS